MVGLLSQAIAQGCVSSPLYNFSKLVILDCEEIMLDLLLMKWGVAKRRAQIKAQPYPCNFGFQKALLSALILMSTVSVVDIIKAFFLFITILRLASIGFIKSLYDYKTDNLAFIGNLPIC